MEAPVLDRIDPNYPKAKYKKVPEGEGDVKSPAYEKITMQNGDAKRVVEFHQYMSALVKNAQEDAALTAEGWVDTPADLDKPKLKPEVKAKLKEFSA